jgi:hypothetical protein
MALGRSDIDRETLRHFAAKLELLG